MASRGQFCTYFQVLATLSDLPCHTLAILASSACDHGKNSSLDCPQFPRRGRPDGKRAGRPRRNPRGQHFQGLEREKRILLEGPRHQASPAESTPVAPQRPLGCRLTQTTLDLQQANSARESAIDQVEANADEQWKAEAKAAVVLVCRTQRYFTTDALWAFLAKPREPRAMGAIMRWAKSEKLIAAAGTDRTASVSRHRGLVTAWQSLVFEG